MTFNEELLSHVSEEADSLLVVHVSTEDKQTYGIDNAVQILFVVVRNHFSDLILTGLRLRLQEDIYALGVLCLHVFA